MKPCIRKCQRWDRPGRWWCEGATGYSLIEAYVRWARMQTPGERSLLDKLYPHLQINHPKWSRK